MFGLLQPCSFFDKVCHRILMAHARLLMRLSELPAFPVAGNKKRSQLSLSGSRNGHFSLLRENSHHRSSSDIQPALAFYQDETKK